MRVRKMVTIDLTRRFSEISFDGVRVEAGSYCHPMDSVDSTSSTSRPSYSAPNPSEPPNDSWR